MSGIPLLKTDFPPGQERQHRTLISSAVNALIRVAQPTDRTDKEVANGITPTDFRYPPGHVFRYGAVGDGITDDYAAFQRAITLSSYYEVIIPYTSGGYKIGTALVAPGNCAIRGINKPQLIAATNGQDILSATGTSTFACRGVRFLGTSASTTPINGYTYGTTTTALLTCTSVTDVLIEDCEFDLFYNGVSVINCDRAWIERNRVRRFYLFGILSSLTNQFSIERNVITECQQTGASIAYGVTATGDAAGGNSQSINSISFNQINGVSSWDGIMSHDVTGLMIVGNDIRDVRTGIDVGHFAATNVIVDVVISDNIIQATATDTWSGGTAATGGILVVGYDGTNIVANCTITGNIVRNFFRVAGMVGGGSPSHITVANSTHVTVTGNVVSAGLGNVNNAGVRIEGRANTLAVTGNSLQGTMGLGGIRCVAVTSDLCAITGNVISQNTTTDPAVAIDSSTLSAAAISGNTTNSSVPYSATSSTVVFTGDYYEGTATYDPPNLADGAGATTTVTVTGAALGDYARASFSLDLQGITVTAWVSAANTVSVRFQNESGGALDLASGTLRARAWKAH